LIGNIPCDNQKTRRNRGGIMGLECDEGIVGRELEERLKRVELVAMDVDGVLTDGGIIFGTQDMEFKSFNVRDQLARF